MAKAALKRLERDAGVRRADLLDPDVPRLEKFTHRLCHMSIILRHESWGALLTANVASNLIRTANTLAVAGQFETRRLEQRAYFE